MIGQMGTWELANPTLTIWPLANMEDFPGGTSFDPLQIESNWPGEGVGVSDFDQTWVLMLRKHFFVGKAPKG